jgi:heterodisulfide reductase subunit A
MYAIREASMVRDHLPGARVAVFYMDMRVFGKDCQAYYDDAEAHEIDFINSRVPLVKQDFSTNDLIISSMSDSGDMLTERFGLVVLSVAQRPSERFAQLGKTLSIEMNRHGFAGSPDLSAVSTSREGIFMCGSASGPMDISGSIAGASAAAGMAMKYVSAAAASPEEDKANPAADTAKTAVFLCDCRGLLSKTLDMGALAEHMKSLPGVEVHLFDNLCAADQRSSMEKIMKESGASGALIGACSIFRPLKAVKDKPAVPVALREEAAWVHEGSAAFEKAKTMMGLAMENLAWRDMRPSVPAGVESRAVILGAGLAGLTAARALADQGLESCIIEKTSQAGGNARHIFTTIDGMDVSARMASLVAEVSDNPLIHIYTGAWLSSIEGNAGAFTCTVKNAEAEDRIDCGAVIVATGGAEFTGALESFGGMKSLVTQRELERLIETKDASLSAMKSRVMIQCAGSRNSERPYCSRVCCSQALKNSLRLKSLYPELSITVLYRDIMSYGLAEEYYTRARESGVVFSRHDLDCLPSVTENTGRPEVKARDLSLGADIILHPDLVVISPAICAGEDNENLSLMLGAELTTGGFFRESEAKFRTVESTREGIFICGLAHSPRSMPETITQARAAAQQAASILRQSKLVQRRAVSEVNQRRCSGCLMCVKACPYGARTKHPERPVVVLSEHLCRGCGACAAVCPNEAATQREFSSHQVFSLIDIAL